MRRRFAAFIVFVTLWGCAEGPHWGRPGAAGPVAYDNPVCIPINDYERVYEGVVDVVGDYFRIEREEPVRLLGTTLTEGRIDTFPKNGATFLEPWEHDSADSYERLESTLQSIRRRAVVRVIPAQSGCGFWVDVTVFKELENVPQPANSTAGASSFRVDNSEIRVINPEHPTGANKGWIPQGRDTALEQRIIGQLQYRFTPDGAPIPIH